MPPAPSALNPIEERKKSSERPTFGHFAEQMIAKKTAELHNVKSAAAWAMTLRIYAKPIYGKIAADVSTEDVLSILKPLWATKPETASRLQGRINAVLDAATAVGARTTANPARWRGHLEHLLPKRKKLSRGHHAALPYAGVPRFMERLGFHDGVSARALEFLILTAARSGEVRGARWSEISVDDALWIVPPARMKARKEHRVPLSDAAMGVLRKMAALESAPDALVLPMHHNVLLISEAASLKHRGTKEPRSQRTARAVGIGLPPARTDIEQGSNDAASFRIQVSRALQSSSGPIRHREVAVEGYPDARRSTVCQHLCDATCAIVKNDRARRNPALMPIRLFMVQSRRGHASETEG